MRTRALPLCLATLAVFSAHARAETRYVGPSETLTTPCLAVATAKPGDVIAIASGTYTDSCAISVAGLTLRGVGTRPVIDLSGTDHPAEYKGIYIVRAEGVTLENLELTGAHIAADKGENAAAIRLEAPGLTVRGCVIHGNQNGLLGGTTGTLTIEHTELYDNGRGDGCNGSGCTHNLYVANIDELVFRYNWSHAIADDTANKGHLLKSRAKVNRILYNRLSGEGGPDSYELDLPNGGLALVIGNVLEKGPRSGNPAFLSWGEEGATNPDARLVLVHNTFVDERGGSTFVRAPGATLTAKNNLLVGAGSQWSGTGAVDGNVQTSEPGFVDRAGFDYRLTDTSPAAGTAVDSGSLDGAQLAPDSQYVQPVNDVARPTHADVGAFERGVVEAPEGDGGVLADAGGGPVTSDAGASAVARDGGASSAGAHDAAASEDAGDDAPARSHGGCSLSVVDDSRRGGSLSALALLLGLLLRRRGRLTA